MRTALAIGFALAGICAAPPVLAQSTSAITFQGQVQVAGQPINSTADFRFRLYDGATSGIEIGPEVTQSGLQVSDGVVTAPIDFGPDAYRRGEPRWIEVDMRSPAGSGNFTTLVPRQPLTPTPFALSTRGLDVDPSGNVGIGKTPAERLDVNGAVRMTGLRLDTPDAAPGSVLTSDALGVASWAPLACIQLPCSSSTNAGGCALSITQTAPGNAICGQSSAGSGTNYGVFGSAGSPDGVGVFGNAVTGVQGVSTSPTGNGVSGYASGSSDAWGVAGETATGQAVIGRAGTGLPGGGFAAGVGVLGYSNVPSGYGMWAQTTDATGFGLLATNTSNFGPGIGIKSYSSSNTGVAIHGLNVAPTGNTVGVLGESSSTSGWGVYGLATATSGNANGVWGASVSPNGTGVIGANTANSGLAAGVHGFSSSTTGGAGVVGSNYMPSGQTYGVYGESSSTTGYGVYGANSGSLGVGVYGYSPLSTGVIGVSDGSGGIGVYGGANAASGTSYAIYGSAVNQTTAYAGYFLGRVSMSGNLNVVGSLSKGSGTFKIDHPLDPENKFLYHSFVESPDMMNIYNGEVTTDAKGLAVITMPDWFDALNRDFRYQLTVVDDGSDAAEWVQARVARRMEGNQFAIRTSRPNVAVSWMVTGIRKDAYAEAHRVRVEEEKSAEDRGSYLHPVEHGQPIERGIEFRRAQQVHLNDGAAASDVTTASRD
jgi:hypothetical protein